MLWNIFNRMPIARKVSQPVCPRGWARNRSLPGEEVGGREVGLAGWGLETHMAAVTWRRPNVSFQ